MFTMIFFDRGPHCKVRFEEKVVCLYLHSANVAKKNMYIN